MNKLALATVVAIAIAVRLIFVFAFPNSGGDWDIYSTVAQNVLDGCGVSLSTPGSGECAPHFGGNQLPGFPAFVAAIWWLTDHSDMAVRVAQMLCYAAALAWLMRAVLVLTKAPRIALLVGLVMALSPLQVAWPRFTQTETLALATNIWVAAELLLSLSEKRLRMIPLSLAFVAAIFTRLDGVLLSVPIAVACFLIYRPTQALRQGLIFALLTALPLTLWAVRNVSVGLPIMPQGMVLPNNAPTPYGYIAWCRSWMTEEYQRPGALYPPNRMVYSGIAIDSRAYDSSEEKAEVERWLVELAQHDRQPFPPSIDTRFARLARERVERSYYRAYISNNVSRALALWRNPFSSFAWPNELPGDFGHQARLEVARSGLAGVFSMAQRYPVEAVTKALTGGYRYLLLGLTLGIFLVSLRRNSGDIGIVIKLVFAVFVARTMFFAVTNNVETRYTVEAVPWMELGVVLAIWGRRHMAKVS